MEGEERGGEGGDFWKDGERGCQGGSGREGEGGGEGGGTIS